MIILLFLIVPSFGTAYAKDTVDGATSTQPSLDKAYDITYEITASFESDPIIMRSGSTGTVQGGPVVKGKQTWWEIQYSDGTKGWSAEDWLKLKISRGSDVKTTKKLDVRNVPGRKDKNDIVMPAGGTGTVLDGPENKDGVTWWKIRYSDGTIGWSEDMGLKLNSEISIGSAVKTTSNLHVRNAPNGISCSPSSLNTKDNGIISYGRHQFTLKYGSLYSVLKRYTELSQTDTSKKIADYLSRVMEINQSLKNDAAFLELLKDAAYEPEMVQAQNEVFEKDYYRTAKELAKADGLTSVLAIVIYVDTNVQGGLAEVRTNTAKEFKGKVIGKDYKEQEWLRVFLEKRQKRLLDVENVNRKKGGSANENNAKYLEEAASPQGRIAILQKLVGSGNLDMKKDPEKMGSDSDLISLGSFGNVYAIDARDGHQDAMQAPGSRKEALATATQKSDLPLFPEKLSGETNDLGGVNFSSINVNFISVNQDYSGGTNFDYVLKGQKAEGNNSVIDPIYSSSLARNAFMSGLALNNHKFEVNLAPWEPNRIVDVDLERTDAGRVMLEADLQMKKDFSNYGNPCANKTGEALMALLDEKKEELVQTCREKFPGEIEDAVNIEFRPVTRFWINPDRIYAYINGTEIYIINSTLNVSSEPVSDHSFYRVRNQNSGSISEACREELNISAKEFGQYTRELEDKMILPYVKYDVNHDKKYEDLRSVYISLALAQWYKANVDTKADIFKEFVDSSNLTGLDSLKPWSPRDIWESYNYSFENGEYKCQKSKPQIVSGMIKANIAIYSSGGVDFARINDKMTLIKGVPQTVQDDIEQAINKGSIDEGKVVLFGTRIHVDTGTGKSILGSSAPSGGGYGYPGSGELIKEEQYHGHTGDGNETDSYNREMPA
jgi:hypothetical protein